MSTRGRITLRGLTSGVISVGDKSRIGSCILIGDQFCAWLPHVQFLGLKIVGILLKSSKLLKLIESKFGDQCDVQVGDWNAANMKADVVLVDGSASQAEFEVANRSESRIVLSTTRRRSNSNRCSTSGWKQVHRERISHQQRGGVTAKIVDLTIHQPRESRDIEPGPPLVQEVPRDASTVLSLKEHCNFFRPIPTPEVIDPLRCVNLGSDEKPIYHGRGLLPASLTRDTWVLTPFLFSPKAKREWGLRRLGIQETLACLDYPDDWAKWLTTAGVDRTFVEQQPPMSCFVAGATRYLRELGSRGNEGGQEEVTSKLEIQKDQKLKGNTVPVSVEPSGLQKTDEGKTLDIELKPALFTSNLDTGYPLFLSKIGKRRNRTEKEASKYDDQWSAVVAKRKFDEKEGYDHDCWPSNEVNNEAKRRKMLAPLNKDQQEKKKVPEREGTKKEPRQKKNRKRTRKPRKYETCLVEGPFTVGVGDENTTRETWSNAEELFPNNEAGFVPGHMRDTLDAGTSSSCATRKCGSADDLRTEQLEEAAAAIREQKAVKSDNAAVPKHLWEQYLFEENPKWDRHKGRFRAACEVLRENMLSFWKRLVQRSLTNWLAVRHSSVASCSPSTKSLVREMPLIGGRSHVHWRHHYKHVEGKKRRLASLTGEVTRRYMWQEGGLEAYKKWWATRMKVASWDLVPGTDAVARAANSTWFEWEDGSRPFHWRWPEFYQSIIRDGLKVHFVSKKPEFKRAQAGNKSPEMVKRMREKIDKVRQRRYIAPGFVASLTSFFAVPKGADDIRMVYDASVSGLNDSIWVPRFPLPTIKTHLRAVEEGTYMADLDVGEMFLNFVLHSDLRALCGVDLTLYGGTVDEFQTVAWEVWQRAAMGLKPSPYQAVQGMMVAEEMIKGDRTDPKNPFRWDVVRLNLPGSDGYDPALPWVSKIRLDDWNIACDIVIFVDDLRVTGPEKHECWKAGQRAAQVLNHLGLQDAPRKRRDASQAPGPWTGSILRTDLNGVFAYVSQEKWDKAKSQIEEVIAMVEQDPDHLDHKRLEQVRGFIQYVTQTYSGMTPYIIGFHLTIDGWREDRTDSGWKRKEGPKEKKPRGQGDGGVSEELLKMEAALGLSREDLGLGSSRLDPPKFVKAVPRFLPDLKALRALMAGEKPPLKRVRCSRVATAIYSFVDASGRGFGSTFQMGDKVHFQYGQWPERISETMSSNWRELANLVESLEAEVGERGLNDVEIFLFTDNTTAEAAYWKGTSKSEWLFDLVLRLRLLEMNHDLIVHVVHVAGTRMQAQGTDGISRGDKSMGVMRGVPMQDFCPLHKTGLERSPVLKTWLTTATKLLKPVFLEPEDWFLQGQGAGNFIWSPAPAAADVVVEQLGKARHKRPCSLHLVVAPRLMTGRWRRHMTRECDFYFKLPAGACSLWNAAQYEPVLIFVCIPFSIANPNFRLRQGLLEDMHRFMLAEGLWQGSGKRGGNLLREFLIRARGLCSL
jgi:hypothetical protein